MTHTTTGEAIDITNDELKAKIKTKHGLTGEIVIKDTIRQEGVLSVTQHAELLDEINYTVTDENQIKWVNINDPTCQLSVHAVSIITNNTYEHQKILDIVSKTANKLCIEFGDEKSETILIGKGDKNN